MHAVHQGAPVDDDAHLWDAALLKRATGIDQFEGGLETKLVERGVAVAVTLTKRRKVGVNGGLQCCVTDGIEFEQSLPHASLAVDPGADLRVTALTSKAISFGSSVDVSRDITGKVGDGTTELVDARVGGRREERFLFLQ